MIFVGTDSQFMQAPETTAVPQPRFHTADRALAVNVPEALTLAWAPLQPGVPARINLGSLSALKICGAPQPPSGATSETRSPRSSHGSEAVESFEPWGMPDDMGQASATFPDSSNDWVQPPSAARPAPSGRVGQHWAAYAADDAESAVPPQVATSPQGVTRKGARNREVATVEHGPTLCAVFRELRGKNPQCVLKLRKLHHLGTGSVEILQRHFERFGCVNDVFVVYSQVKAPSRGGVVRCKPSGLGFIVMHSPEDVEKALRFGEEQTVGISKVIVERFRLLDSSSD